jgi:hypothetical protein
MPYLVLNEVYEYDPVAFSLVDESTPSSPNDNEIGGESTLAVETLAGKDKFIVIYPNPSNGKFTLAYDISQFNDKAKVRVTDAQGKLVEHFELGRLIGKQTMDLSYLATGTYYCSLWINESKVYNTSIVINK